MRPAHLGHRVTAGLLALLPAAAVAGTTTSTYTYNADGALTSITVEQDGGSASTSYLTWDNFTPQASDPGTGALSAADGNLVSVGAQPGGAAQFSFDVRNRLTGHQPSTGAAQTYGYDADSILGTAQIGTDAVTFYHAGEPHAQVVNQTQSSTGLISARLGPARYLSDGLEQLLIAPRKDTSGVLDPVGGTLSTYEYDPYGAGPASEQEGAAAGYDLADNPFRYAGEYRDPQWGGYYLRARWYDPDLPSFISRDPVPNLNRFAYAGGNPLMHVDPGGTNFFHGLQNLNRELNKGVGGGFARFFLAPFMGTLALAAEPKEFWTRNSFARNEMFVFLFVGALSEGAGGYMDLQAVKDVVSLNRGWRWGYRTFSDVLLGGAQSALSGYNRGTHHFDVKSFEQGLEMTGGAIGFWRGFMHVNVRSGFRSGAEAAEIFDKFQRVSGTSDALIFRVKAPLWGSRQIGLGWSPFNESPIQETAGLGLYHEKLIAITTRTNAMFQEEARIYTTEFFGTGINQDRDTWRSVGSIRNALGNSGSRYELVGRVGNFNEQAFFANPRGLRLNMSVPGHPSYAPAGTNGYNVVLNNCHTHAYWVLKSMGLR